MRKYKWWIVLGVVLLVLLVYFILPVGNRQQSISFEDAKDIVTKVKEHADDIKSYKINTEISAASIVEVNMTDYVIRDQNKRQLIEIKWEAPQTNGNTSMYSDGKLVYVYHPVKNKWVLPSEEPTASPYFDFFWGQLGMVDPIENLSNIDPNGKNIKVSKIKGNTDSIVLEVTPEPGDFSDIAKHLPPQFSSAELKDLKQYFTISKKDLNISKYEVKANISIFGIKALKFQAVSIPSEYNETNINLPPELAEKLKQ